MLKLKRSRQIRTTHLFVSFIALYVGQSLLKIAQSGVEILFEIGPNKVLTGLTSRIVKEIKISCSK